MNECIQIPLLEVLYFSFEFHPGQICCTVGCATECVDPVGQMSELTDTRTSQQTNLQTVIKIYITDRWYLPRKQYYIIISYIFFINRSKLVGLLCTFATTRIIFPKSDISCCHVISLIIHTLNLVGTFTYVWVGTAIKGCLVMRYI